MTPARTKTNAWRHAKTVTNKRVPAGGTVSEHPEEELLVHARAQQHTAKFRGTYRERQTDEHRLARMMQLGARQARYFGGAKTELQWFIAATVANLTLAISHRNPDTNQEPTKGGSRTLPKAFTILIQRATAIWRSRTPEPHQTMCTA